MVLSEDAFLTILSDKNIIPPFGVLGGFWGEPNRFGVLREGKWVEPSPVPGKVTRFPLEKGDVVIMETSGGGGYGEPLERDLQKIEGDLLAGVLTEEKAEARYGIILRSGQIDRKETELLREKVRNERDYLRISPWDGGEYLGTRRMCLLGSKTIENLGLREGDLVELVNFRAPPLRAWVYGLEHGAEGAVYLGKLGMEILGVRGGAEVELRHIQR